MRWRLSVRAFQAHFSFKFGRSGAENGPRSLNFARKMGSEGAAKAAGNSSRAFSLRESLGTTCFRRPAYQSRALYRACHRPDRADAFGTGGGPCGPPRYGLPIPGHFLTATNQKHAPPVAPPFRLSATFSSLGDGNPARVLRRTRCAVRLRALSAAGGRRAPRPLGRVALRLTWGAACSAQQPRTNSPKSLKYFPYCGKFLKKFSIVWKTMRPPIVSITYYYPAAAFRMPGEGRGGLFACKTLRPAPRIFLSPAAPASAINSAVPK